MYIRIGILVAFFLVFFLHIYKIADIPRGIYIDETSIGYNAILITETGRDEHQRLLPVVLESFGDAKNSLYVYAVVLMFKIFGASDWSLRMTSAVLFMAFLMGIVAFVRRIFPKNHVVAAYAFTATAFMPWFFAMSRISFEVISQLPSVIWALYFVHRTFHPTRAQKHWWIDPMIAGIFVGLSVYSYSTARLLSFFFALFVLLFYFRKSTWKPSAVFAAATGMTIIPYAIFFYLHPDIVTGRFKAISYLSDNSISLFGKVSLFFQTIFAHLTPQFLFFEGDPNIRHATGVAGEIFFMVFVLACFGILAAVISRRFRTQKFTMFLLINLLCSPIAAALTREAIPHSLRTVLLGLYLLIFSCFGFVWLQEQTRGSIKTIVVTMVFVLLLLESTWYLQDYFGRYAIASAEKFDAYGMHLAFDLAYAQHPKKGIVSKNIDYTQYEFFSRTVRNTQNIPLERNSPVPEKNACVIFLPSDEKAMRTKLKPTFQMNLPNARVFLNCYL